MSTTAHTICPFCRARTRPPGSKTCGNRRCDEALHYGYEVDKCRKGSSKRADALLVYAAACMAARADGKVTR